METKNDFKAENKVIDELLKQAMFAQDACNLSGVVFAFSKAMEVLCKLANKYHLGADWKNNHPVSILYASKIASLTHCEDTDTFSHAYNVAAIVTNESEA